MLEEQTNKLKEQLDKLVVNYTIKESLIEKLDLNEEELLIFNNLIDENGITIIEDYNENYYTENSTFMYLYEINKIRLLTTEQEQELTIKAFNGDKEAKTKLLEANLRLVVLFAKRNIGKGVPFIDLIQEGNIGLMKAIDRFDPSKGCKLSTYAPYWILQSIRRAIVKSKPIYIPVETKLKINKINKEQERFYMEFNRNATIEELVDLTGYSKELTKELIQASQLKTLYFEECVKNGNSDNDSTFEVFLEDKNAHNFVTNLERKDLIDKVSEYVDLSLTGTRKDIIKMRYGLNGTKQKSIEEIAEEFNVSRQAINEQAVKGLRDLRYSSYCEDYLKLLEEYIDKDNALPLIEDQNEQKKIQRHLRKIESKET